MKHNIVIFLTVRTVCLRKVRNMAAEKHKPFSSSLISPQYLERHLWNFFHERCFWTKHAQTWHVIQPCLLQHKTTYPSTNKGTPSNKFRLWSNNCKITQSSTHDAEFHFMHIKRQLVIQLTFNKTQFFFLFTSKITKIEEE